MASLLLPLPTPVCASLIFSPPPVDLQLAAVRNGDGLLSGAVLGADLLDGLDDLKTLDNLAEDDVLAVQPGGLDGADEELGAVGSCALNQFSNLKTRGSVLSVPGPALAMERIPGPVCLRLKFSSSNFSP